MLRVAVMATEYRIDRRINRLLVWPEDNAPCDAVQYTFNLQTALFSIA
jgi:hypothetical protein